MLQRVLLLISYVSSTAGYGITLEASQEPAVLPLTAFSQQQAEQAQVSDEDNDLDAPQQWHTVQEPSDSPQTPQQPFAYQSLSSQPVNVAPSLPSLNLVGLHQGGVLTHAGAPSMRPNAASGKPEVVKFGIFSKAFYGASMKRNKFAVDMVMNLEWKDERAISTIPSGMDSVTMSGDEASKLIWMPSIVVTNRDIRKYEEISNAVVVQKDGTVQRVERAGVVCKERYNLEEYPFDTQDMRIKIASEKYMLDELVMEPMDDASVSGTKKGFFTGFEFEKKGHKLYSIEETDGALSKSRGVLEIRAKRNVGNYFETHLVPSALLIMISWGVFYFPFEQPFITPRLALSILALLTFTNLMIKSGNEIPDGSPFNWNDCLNQDIQIMMFFTIVLNIFCEMVKHKFGLKEASQHINRDCQVLVPSLSFIAYTIVLTGGAAKWLSVKAASSVTKSMIFIVMLIYFGMLWGILNQHYHLKEDKEHQAEDELHEAWIQAGGDASKLDKVIKEVAERYETWGVDAKMAKSMVRSFGQEKLPP